TLTGSSSVTGDGAVEFDGPTDVGGYYNLSEVSGTTTVDATTVNFTGQVDALGAFLNIINGNPVERAILDMTAAVIPPAYSLTDVTIMGLTGPTDAVLQSLAEFDIANSFHFENATIQTPTPGTGLVVNNGAMTMLGALNLDGYTLDNNGTGSIGVPRNGATDGV